MHNSGHLLMSGEIFGYYSEEEAGEEMPSADSRPEMLLNILKHTRQPPTTKNNPVQNVNSASIEKPRWKESYLFSMAPS